VGGEDRDLARRLAFLGGVDYTPARVARIRIGEAGSTTVWSTLAENDRRGREKALALPGAAQRLREDIGQDHSLRGRITRAYLASAAWNLKHRRIGTAVRRLDAGLSFCRPRVFSGAYWHGLRTKGG
jgi:hypothetical protein